MLLEVQQVAVEAQRFEFAMRGREQRAARSFIAAARLDADKAILDQSMRPTALRPPISFSNSTSETGSRACPPTETGTPFSNPISTVPPYRGLLAETWSSARSGEGRVGRVFEFSAFVAQVPEVAVAAVNLLPARGDRNAALSA